MLSILSAGSASGAQPGPAASPGIEFHLVHRGAEVSFYEPAAPDSGQAAATRGLDLASLDRVATSTIERLTKVLDAPAGNPVQIYLLPEGEVRTGGSLASLIPPWAAGAAFGEIDSIVLVVGRHMYPDQDLEGVIAHECAHIVLDRALDRARVRVPRWFEEGFAVHEARPWGWQDALTLATTLIPATPPPLSTFAEGFPENEAGARQAYAISVSFIDFLVRRSDSEAPIRIARAMAGGRTFDEAIRNETGSDLAALEAGWIEGAQMRYRWIPILTSTGAIWMVIMILLFVAGLRRRARRHELEAEWEA